MFPFISPFESKILDLKNDVKCSWEAHLISLYDVANEPVNRL